jgi:signal transduction histidine kinase
VTSGLVHHGAGGDGVRAHLAVQRSGRAVGAVFSRRWFRLALCLLGIATAPLIVLPVVRSGGLDALDTTAVLMVLVPCSFVATGFIAWDRRPENRVGALLMILGLSWTVGRLMGPPTTSSSLVNTVGIVWRLAWVFGFVFVLLSFPRGRLSRVVDKVLAGVVFLVAVPMEILWLLFVDRDELPNAFLVWPSEWAADAIDTAQRIIFISAALALVGMLARRWIGASRALRRTLAPVVAGGFAVLGFSAFVVVEKFHPVPTYLWWDVFAAYAIVPVALLASILRARLARSSVGDLFIELQANPAPQHLRDALARALGDPSLMLAYWLPEYETYADLDGRPVELPDDSSRATTLVDREDAHLAALVHDASLREEPKLLDAVCAAAGIALEHAQLQSELRARLEELKGSRARILKAAQTERQRLERNLHDGAQQRLVSLSLELGVLGARLDGDAEAKQALHQARRELAESLQELRELARGIHPAVVTGHGLDVALESLVARTPINVRLTVDLDGRLPEPVEVAAYYLVSESLTNVARYARASGAAVDVARGSGQLVVEVVDDGVGGANTDGGSGLRGLADRVEALGGRLRVWSPAGGGTRIRAEIPCE